MTIVIEAGESKRQIEGPFNICGSREDLLEIADRILKEADKDDFYYGWVSVSLRAKSIVNTPPKKWDE